MFFILVVVVEDDNIWHKEHSEVEMRFIDNCLKVVEGGEDNFCLCTLYRSLL